MAAHPQRLSDWRCDIVVPLFPLMTSENLQFLFRRTCAAIVFKAAQSRRVFTLEDVKIVNGQWLVAGTSGVVLIVIGSGQTMRQTQAQVYSRIKNVLIPNMYSPHRHRRPLG